jgi:hypothetical protein
LSDIVSPLAGLETGADAETGGGVSISEQLTNWWRDASKCGMWLHLITHSSALIPFGPLSSCSIMVVANLKNPKGCDVMIATLAHSEKGFVDEPWRRFLAPMPLRNICPKSSVLDSAIARHWDIIRFASASAVA